MNKLDSKNLPYQGDITLKGVIENPSYQPVISDIVDSINIKGGNLISNFKEVGTYSISGNYDANSTNIPKFSLNIRTLPDITFRFLLSIQVEASDPVLYTSEEYYSDLVSTYNEQNPYMVLNAIKFSAIISVSLDKELKKILDIRSDELSVGKIGILVTKNTFLDTEWNLSDEKSVSNYETTQTIDFDSVARYVDKIISKKTGALNVDGIPIIELGSWKNVS